MVVWHLHTVIAEAGAVGVAEAAEAAAGLQFLQPTIISLDVSSFLSNHIFTLLCVPPIRKVYILSFTPVRFSFLI